MASPTYPTLAFKLEAWAIDILSEHELFPGVKAGSEEVMAGDEDTMAGDGFAIVHQDEETRAAVNRIVVTAKVGDKESGGAQPFNVELELRVILIDKAQDTVEHYTRAIEETFADPPTVSSLRDFSYLSLIEEESEDRDNRRDSRQRARIYNFHALETDRLAAPENITATDNGDGTFDASYNEVSRATQYEYQVVTDGVEGEWISNGANLVITNAPL